MNSPLRILSALTLAIAAPSCSHMFRTDYGVPGAGYDDRAAYNQGFSDGSGDRSAGRAHNPHINEDSATLPAAYRKEYVWGYIDGYRGMRGTLIEGSK